MKFELNQSSLLPLVENDLQAAQKQCHQYKAEPVHLETVRQSLLAFLFQNLRLVHQPMHQQQRNNSDRYIDEKDPVPGVVVGDPAAERGPDRRRDDYRHTIKRER